MRKPWIAVATIALLAGLAAGYRIARPGNSPRESARADRASGTPPNDSSARTDAPASRQAAPIVPEIRREPAVRGLGAGADGARSPQSSSGETASAPPRAAPSPAAMPISLPNTTEAPKQEPASEDDRDSDRHPPVLQYLRFDPPEIADGGVVMLSVGSTDDLSGVKSVDGTMRSPSEAAIVPFTAQDPIGGGLFSATIPIPRQAETGVWFVASLQIVDKAGNTLNLAFGKANVPQGGALRVSSEESDSIAPYVHGVSIDKGTVGAGEMNRIVVRVDDDRSGVASVTGSFQSPSRFAFISFACSPNDESSSWEGAVPIPANADCGEWTLRQLRVADKANNLAFVSVDSPQLGRVSFVVSGGGACDADPPVIDTLEFSPTIVSNTVAHDITLTVRAHDDGSGVGSLSGRIEGPVSEDGHAPGISFECAPDPKDPVAPMIARISIPEHAAKGLWRVTLVQVRDKARNFRTYSKDDPALGDAGFTVE